MTDRRPYDPLADETEPGVHYIGDPPEWLRVVLPYGFRNEFERDRAIELLDQLRANYPDMYSLRGSVRYRLLWERGAVTRSKQAPTLGRNAIRPHESRRAG